MKNKEDNAELSYELTLIGNHAYQVLETSF